MPVTVRDITREFDDISYKTVLSVVLQKGWIDHPHMTDWSQWTFNRKQADELRALLYAHLQDCTEALQCIYKNLRQGDGNGVEVATIEQQLGSMPVLLRERLNTLACKGLVSYKTEGGGDTVRVVSTEAAAHYLDERELEKLFDRSLSWEPPFVRPGRSVDT